MRIPRGRGVKADRGWKRPFDNPLDLPRGREFVTLNDAAGYIVKLSLRNGRPRPKS